MKKNIHPPYRKVLFVDSSTGYKFACGSTIKTEKTEEFEGEVLPAFFVSVSSASHPFFTGSNKFVDSEGRVDKFLKRYAAASKKIEETSQSAQVVQEPEKKKPKKK